MKITRKGYYTITGPDGHLLAKPDGSVLQVTSRDEAYERVTEDGRDGTFTVQCPDRSVDVAKLSSNIAVTLVQQTVQKVVDPQSALSGVFPSTYPQVGALLVGGNIDWGTDAAIRQLVAQSTCCIIGQWKGYSQGGMNLSEITADIKARATTDGNPHGEPRLFKYSIIFEDWITPTVNLEIKAEVEANTGATAGKDWFLYDADGTSKVLTFNDQKYVINCTDFVTVNVNGDYFPEWMAEFDNTHFINGTTSSGFDYIFMDLWNWRPGGASSQAAGDWDGDGINDSNPSVGPKLREANIKYKTRIESLQGRTGLMGNVGGDVNTRDGMNSEAEHFQSCWGLAELTLGRSFSEETWGGWIYMMDRISTTKDNSLDEICFTNGDISSATAYSEARYFIASCLQVGALCGAQETYNLFNWWDEYDNAGSQAVGWLGKPIGLFRTFRVASPPVADSNGCYFHEYDNGIAVVNPKGNGPATCILPSAGAGFHWALFTGIQDPAINDGSTVTQIVFASDRDGRVITRVAD